MDMDYKSIVAIFSATIFLAVCFKKHRKMIFGAGGYRIINWILDNPVWISAELFFGRNGVLVMVASAIITNSCLFIYFRNKQTTFTVWNCLDGFAEKEKEYQKKFKEWKKGGNPLKIFFVIGAYVPMKVFLFLLKFSKVPFWGDCIALVALSIFQDPFVAITYVRHGDTGKLTGKIIFIFFVSVVIGIGYWTIRNGLIAELLFRPVLM
jgi:hypothetical protein